MTLAGVADGAVFAAFMLGDAWNNHRRPGPYRLRRHPTASRDRTSPNDPEHHETTPGAS